VIIEKEEAMTSSNRKVMLNTATNYITEGTKKLAQLREEAVKAEPELEKTASELLSTLNSALAAMEKFIPEDEKTGPTLRRFIRRLLSREVIVAVVAIIAIWAGDLNAEQAIGVAVAGTGLILGRSAVKTVSKTTE
jgi:hypothetical protein